jgi:prepilin-type processing-associated H-X9-DG protein
MSESEQKVCPQCGARFECRASAGCWCAQWPALGPVEPPSDCLCPKCLERACRREKEGFRHPQRAKAAFCDGHVGLEKLAPGSVDPKN